MASKTDVRELAGLNSNRLAKVYDYALSDSYTTGGEFVDLSDDFDEIDAAHVVDDPVDDTNDRYFAAVISGTYAGVKAYDATSNLDEVSAATDLSGTTVRLRVEGLVKGGVDATRI